MNRHHRHRCHAFLPDEQEIPASDFSSCHETVLAPAICGFQPIVQRQSCPLTQQNSGLCASLCRPASFPQVAVFKAALS